jgi:hypothetical protein
VEKKRKNGLLLRDEIEEEEKVGAYNMMPEKRIIRMTIWRGEHSGTEGLE